MSDEFAPDLIRSLFDRWQRLEEDKAAVSSDLKDLFAEAKGHGFDGKALRIAFRKVLKANDVAEEELNTVVELYVGAILDVGTKPATRTRAARETPSPASAEPRRPKPADD